MFGFLAIWLFASIVSVAAANLGRKKTLGAPPSFQVPATPAGIRIPVVYGTWRVRPITTWFGGVKATPVYSYQTPKLGPIVVGGPQSQQVGYEYAVTMQGVLCWGDTHVVNMVFGDNILLSDQSPTQTIYNAVPDPSGGDATITANVIAPAPASYIDFWFGSVTSFPGFYAGKQFFFLPTIYGEPGRGGGVKGKIAWYAGMRQPGADEVMVAHLGAGNVPSYGDISYVVYDELIVGESPVPNPIDFIIRGRGGAENIRFITGRSGRQWRMEDARHSDMLLDALTHPRFGKKTPEWQINRASFTDAATRLATESLGGSMCVGGPTGPQIETYEQMRNECERTCGGKLRRNPETFQWEFKLLRDESSSFYALPHYDEDDLSEFEWQQGDPNEVINEVTVVYSDAELLFERATVTLRNDSNILQTGETRGEVIEYLSITRRETALKLCARDLKQRAKHLGRGKARGSLALWRVMEGDVIRVSNAKHRLTDMMMRVLTIDRGTPTDSAIGITFAEDVFGHDTVVRTNDPTPPVLTLPTIARPVVTSVVQSEAAAIGTAEITLLDVEHRIIDIAFKTKSGTEAESDWVSVASASPDTSDATFPFNDHVTDGDLSGAYSRTVALSDDAPSTIRYRVRYIAFSSIADPTLDVQQISGIVQFRQLPPPPNSNQTLTEADPIIWDVTGKMNDTANVSLFGNRTLDIVGELAGFQGTLLVSTSAARVLTVPENSYVPGTSGNTLSVDPGHTRFTVTFDGVRFWWNNEGTSQPSAALAAALSAAASLTASLTTQPRLEAALAATASLTAALTTDLRLAAALSASASLSADLTDAASGLPVAGAVLWLKPDATTMYTDHPATTLVASDGDPVRVWADSSGNGFDCFHDSGYPLYRPGVTNRSKPSVGFEGSSSAMALTVPAGVMSALQTAGEGEVFVVLKNRAGNTASARGLWTFGNSGESTPSTYPWSDGLFYNDFGSNARKNSISPGQDLSDAFSVLNIWSKTNDWALVLDTVSLFTTGSNTVSFPSGGQAFGSMPTGNLDAYVQELVIFPFKLTTLERAAMNTYLTT